MGLAAGLALMTYGTYESMESQKEAATAQKKALKEQQRRSDIEAYRARVQQVREARAARGATLQTAQALGVSGSSSALGAAGSIQSQMGANISFLDTMQQSARQQSIFQGQALDAQSKAAEWGAYAQLGGSIFQSQGGFKELFKGSAPPPSLATPNLPTGGMNPGQFSFSGWKS